MNKWMLRGVVFAAVMVVLRVIQGTLKDSRVLLPTVISDGLLTIFITLATLWCIADGRADASANPDPDRR
ncbi:MAG: hypothetical protein ACK5M9_10890, partial [Mycobacterium sp.]